MQTYDAFMAQFPDDESCKAFLARKRWPDGVTCPRCDNPRVYKLNFKPWHWMCKVCGGKNGYRFSVITGTIFQDTKIPLRTWFKVGYLMLTAKKGISSLQIHRVIFGENSGSDWRTSWYMCHRWRAAMRGERCTSWTALSKWMRPTSAAKTATGTRARRAPICGLPGRLPATPRLESSGLSLARAASWRG